MPAQPMTHCFRFRNIISQNGIVSWGKAYYTGYISCKKFMNFISIDDRGGCPMELTQLKYFAAIAETQHITKAAEALNVSQPALSHSLRKLEQELNIPLFNRIGRNIVLTPYGHSFYANVRRIFLELENAARERREMDTEMERLYLGTTCPDILSSILLDFLEDRPMLRLRQTLLQTEDITFSLSNGKIDAVIMDEPLTQAPQGDDSVLGTFHLYAVVGKEGQWKIETDTLPIPALQSIPKITVSGNSSLSVRISQLLTSAGIPQIHDIDVSSPVEGLRFAAMGYGAYLTSEPVLYKALERYSEDFDTSDIRILPVVGDGCSWNLNMVISPYSQGNPLLQQLQDYLKVCLEEYTVLTSIHT